MQNRLSLTLAFIGFFVFSINTARTEEAKTCLFCLFINQQSPRIIAEYAYCYVIEDANPVNKGHILIISKNHFHNWFNANLQTKEDILIALDEMKNRIDKQYHPDGYNIGMNCGEAAGQTINHLHVHLIPRYRGDVENPRGGVRGIIPEKQKY